mgnify:CR=1 FL=1
MTSHVHVDHGNLPGYFLVRAREPGDTGRECDCLDGELELFHDACEAGEVDESCPCADCQADRNVRFREWAAREVKAAAKEHAIAGEAGPDV